LLIELASDSTYDQILTAVADLDLPLHRLDQRRHRVAELFDTSATGATQGEAAHV
jgi:ABC-2 type transport system ATP-binding protein